MKKKFKRFMAGMLALVMILSTIIVSPVTAEAAKKTVTVSTQKQLDKALKDGFSGTIVIKTQKSIKLTVKSGNYKKTTLKVNAPKATITNKATFSTIKVTDAKKVMEQGKGNKYQIADKKLDLAVSSKASVSSVNVTAKNGNVNLKVDGKVTSVSVDAKANVEINGKTKTKVKLTVNEKGADVSVNVKASVTVNADASISLEKGAKGSSVKVTKENINVEVENNTGKTVTIKDAEGTSHKVETGKS